MMRNSELASSDVTAFDVNDTQKQAQEKQIFQPVKPCCLTKKDIRNLFKRKFARPR